MALYFENLIVWQKSFLLAKKIHMALKEFPKEELYALTDQMRRSSTSIASNIAEWSGRGTNNEKNHFYHIAKWSAMELQTQVLLAGEFWYIEESFRNECTSLIEEIVRMLYAMTQK